MRRTASNTGKKQAKPGNPRIVEAGKKTRFRPNNPETGEKDERINRKGRPRTADALREMVLDIFNEEGRTAEGKKVTILRNMLLTMAMRGTPADRGELLNRGFGKVADEIVFTPSDVEKILDYLPPELIDALAKGETFSDVLIRFFTTYGASKEQTDRPAQ